jgi:hypothetical protein
MAHLPGGTEENLIRIARKSHAGIIPSTFRIHMDQWRALVNTAMNLWVPQNVYKFFSG